MNYQLTRLSRKSRPDPYLIVFLATVITTTVFARQSTPQQTPTFRVGTDVVLVEAQVSARDGAPMEGIKSEQFEVFIDGRKRPVISAELTRTSSSAPAAAPSLATMLAPTPPTGRVIVVAIDQTSFPSTANASAREAALRLVKRVDADDYLGLVAFPSSVAVAPTRDRAAVRAAIDKVNGHRVEALPSRFNLSASEAIALKSRDPVTTREINIRLCQQEMAKNPTCRDEVLADAMHIATTLEQQATLSITGLHSVIDALETVPGRKTLIVVSAGLPMSMRPGSQVNFSSETDSIGRRTAAANVNLYVLYMNVHFMRYFSAAYGRQNRTIFEDISVFGTGLERFADTGGGSFFQVEVGSETVVDRVLKETSAYYLLAVRTEPDMHDGKPHFIRVTVNQRGAALRYRRIVTIPPAKPR